MLIEKQGYLKPKAMFLFFICSMTLLYFFYAPVINIQFYHHDIYKFADGGIEKTCMENDGFFNNLIQARPLVGLLDCLNFKLANNLEKMAYVRFSCLIILSIFSTFLAWFIHSNIKPNEYVFPLLIGVACACFPGMQTFMIMGAHSIILASLIALCAYTLIATGIDKLRKYRNVPHASIWFGLGGILLLASMLIYPAVSAFFLLPPFILLVFSPINHWPTNKAYLLYSVIIFFAICALYFIIGKITQHFLISDSFSQRYAFNPNFHLAERVVTLLLVYPTLWSIQYPLIGQSVVIYIFTIVGIVVSLRAAKKYSPIEIKNRNRTVVAIIFLMLMGAYAYLMQPENLVFTRILLVFQVMGFFLLFALLSIAARHWYKNDHNIRVAFAIFFVFIAGISANYTVINSALNDRTELNYLMAALQDHLFKSDKIKRVHIVGLQSDSKNNFNGHHERDDIFNINSTLYRQDAYFMVKAALHELIAGNIKLYNCALNEFKLMKISVEECIKDSPKDGVIVTYSRRGEKINATQDTLVIDMSEDAIKLHDGR